MVVCFGFVVLGYLLVFILFNRVVVLDVVLGCIIWELFGVYFECCFFLMFSEDVCFLLMVVGWVVKVWDYMI